MSQLCALSLLLGLIGTRPYVAGGAAALCCLVAACALLRAAWCAPNGWRLDISPAGVVRLTVYQSLRQPLRQTPRPALPAVAASMPSAAADAAPAGEAVALASGSTLWPGLLCLCWRGDGQGAAVLAWPGNVAAGDFRALALACRAIAQRDGMST